MLTVVILAGGLATRLHPLTKNIPKALVPVNGEPFILKQLRYLSEQGVRRVVLCVAHLGEMIQEVVAERHFLIDVTYSFDGPTRLGTGGAVRKASESLSGEFFVLYGDSYLPINFNDVETAYRKSGKGALMTILKNSDRWDKSNVLWEDGRIVEYNKRTPTRGMKHIDYGLGIISKDVISRYPSDKPFDLADIYNELSLDEGLAGFEVFERFYEIGSH
jgi:MurNAc alpha-1-phosphate uridylyltransferase